MAQGIAPEICIAVDTAAIWDEAARRFAAAAKEAVAARGRFMVALSGGSTPEGLYRELATRHTSGVSSGAAAIPWSKTHVFFGDERYVPHGDPQSNYRMAREALLDHVPLLPDHVHPMPTDKPDPAAAAAEYEQVLRKEFGAGERSTQHPVPGTQHPVPSTQYPVPSTQYRVPGTPSPIPRFDLILLGMGPDGHTASLFPGSEAIHEQRRLVVAPWVEKFKTYRLTLTPPVLCNARAVLFLASGAGKADMLHAVINGPFQPEQLPSQIVRPTDGRLTWLVDEVAAAKLRENS